MSELGSGSPFPKPTLFSIVPESAIDSYPKAQYPVLGMTYTFKLLSPQITQNESFLISQTFKYVFLYLDHSELLKPINMGWVLEVMKLKPSSLSGLLMKMPSLVILIWRHWWHTKFQLCMCTHIHVHTVYPPPFPLCSQSLGETLLSRLHLNLSPPNVPFPKMTTLKISIDVNPGVERGINLLPEVLSVSNPISFAHTMIYSARLLRVLCCRLPIWISLFNSVLFSLWINPSDFRKEILSCIFNFLRISYVSYWHRFQPLISHQHFSMTTPQMYDLFFIFGKCIPFPPHYWSHLVLLVCTCF